MKFESIILINDLIGRIEHLSYEIRIQALNSYLVTTSENSTVGFSAVSSSLVDFSQEIEKQSSKLRERIYETLNSLTKLYQIRRSYKVLIRTIDKSRNSKVHLNVKLKLHEDSLNMKQKKIKQELINLASLVQHAFKLCKSGHYIAICSKVEAAHISNNANFFRLITEKVENSVLQILDALESIQKEIKVNLMEDEQIFI